MDDRSKPVQVAAFDIGSNSIKMTIATVAENGQVAEGYSAMKTVRLGEGVDRTGRLAEDRAAAALEALDEMSARARHDGVTRMIGVATEAVRVAVNGAEFLREIEQRTGIEITLITGDQEAALTYAGLATLRTLEGPVLMVDIGGASTEIVAGDGPQIRQAASIPLGSGRLTDAYLVGDPPSKEEFRAATEAAGRQLDFLKLDQFNPSQLIISGGTGTYLSQFLEDPNVLTREQIATALRHMLAMTSEELADRIGIAPLRARVLPAGVGIVLEVIERLGPSIITVSPSGLRIGLLQAAARGDLM